MPRPVGGVIHFWFKFQCQVFDAKLREKAKKLIKESGFAKAIDLFNFFSISYVFCNTGLIL